MTNIQINKNNEQLTKGMAKALILILFIVVPGLVSGQGLNLSQYARAPLFYNPAAIGANPSPSLNFHYRGQSLAGGEDARSSIFTGQYTFTNKANTKRTGGLGVSFLHDTQGSNNELTSQGLSAAYAYNLQIAKRQYISYGMQAGYFQQKAGALGLSTGNQWNPLTGFDPLTPSGEAFENERVGFLTLGAGLLYYKEDSSGRQVASLGVAGLQLNQPDISFTGEENPLPAKYVAHGHIALLRNRDWTVGPELYYAYDNRQSFVQGGILARRYFKNENPFDLLKSGFIEAYGRYREGRAAAIGLGLQQPNFALAVGYDYALSQNALPGDAFEISLVLRKPPKVPEKPLAKAIEGDYAIGQARDIIFERERTDNPTKGQEEGNPEEGRTQGDFSLALRKDFKFGFNKAELDNEGKAYLDELAALLKASPNLKLEVTGHTDDVGSPAANKKVSQRRADVVAKYLKKQGINPKRIKTTAMGDKAPLVANDSENNRAKNRRVEFRIYE